MEELLEAGGDRRPTAQLPPLLPQVVHHKLQGTAQLLTHVAQLALHLFHGSVWWGLQTRR
jgi:hypothetical protein